MAIVWEEVEVQTAERMMVGYGGSGEKYNVWYGPVFLSPDTAAMRWVAQGWPEYDSDCLPLLDSYDDAVALCEQWEAIKLDAEKRARAAFTGMRAGQG